jgi:hypothetical protein
MGSMKSEQVIEVLAWVTFITTFVIPLVWRLMR